MDRPAAPRRRWRAWLLSAIALTLALPAACTGWFFLASEDPAPYLATIDALPVPAAWEVVHTQTLRDPLFGSRADRYYLVDAEPGDIAPVVDDVLRKGGLEIYDRVASSDWCDQRPIGASPCGRLSAQGDPDLQRKRARRPCQLLGAGIPLAVDGVIAGGVDARAPLRQRVAAERRSSTWG